jgi:hypothetical protein
MFREVSVPAVPPDRPRVNGVAWEVLQAWHDRIEKWVGPGLIVVKIGDLLPEGLVAQIDSPRVRRIFDSQAGWRRGVHALIFTAVFSRHTFVWLTFSQTQEAMIAGCEPPWRSAAATSWC